MNTMQCMKIVINCLYTQENFALGTLVFSFLCHNFHVCIIGNLSYPLVKASNYICLQWILFVMPSAESWCFAYGLVISSSESFTYYPSYTSKWQKFSDFPSYPYTLSIQLGWISRMQSYYTIFVTYILCGTRIEAFLPHRLQL